MRLGGLVSAIRRSTTKERDDEPACHSARERIPGIRPRHPRADGDDAARRRRRRGQAPAGRRPPGPLGAPRPVREAAATPGPQRGGLGRLSEKSGASRARTGDLVHAMHALSQLSYGPKLLANSSGEIESVVPRDCPRTGTVPKNGSRFGAATGTVPFGDSPSDYAVADAASTDTEGTSPHSSSSR